MSDQPQPAAGTNGELPVAERDAVVVRFAGDSGDGMQLTGTEFTRGSALAGNDIATFPDFPAEIRAPAGSLAGVSGFQVHFSKNQVYTPGDQPDVLVAMNPAALKVNIDDLRDGGILLLNSDGFNKGGYKKAGYEGDPLTDGSLGAFQVFPVAMTKNVGLALAGMGMGSKDTARCKNFYALGIMYWLYNWPMDRAVGSIELKFKAKPTLLEANVKAFKAGYNYGETAELFASTYKVAEAKIEPGLYRTITGNQAIVYGLLAAAQLSKRPVFLGSYPITPASDILHGLSQHKNFDVITFQAEDEIAAAGAALGASYAGAIGVCSTSGPGVALKSETISLTLTAELPMVVIDVQRAGPSTGMPTKTEQADLLMALYGRHGESPVAILAPATPSECFDLTVEAVRLATKYMVPVFLMSDNYLANGADKWRIPKVADMAPIEINYRTDPEGFLAYERDPETLARPWAVPGTPGLEHRIGGLEKENLTGNVSYDPQNHEYMCRIRGEKVQRIQQDIPPIDVTGERSGDLLLLGWGSTYGSLRKTAEVLQAEGHAISHAHIRHLSPLPKDIEELCRSFKKVMVCELNFGQLALVLRDRFLLDVATLNKVQGKPFFVPEVIAAAREQLGAAPAGETQTAPAPAAS